MPSNTLLLIEDSFTQSKIIRQSFDNLTDFTVVSALSLAEAKEILEEQKDAIFVAVVDLNLPDAPDGETVDLCKSYGIPCIVLAATVDDTLRKKLIDKSVVNYFLKGTRDDLTTLIDAVSRVHSNFSIKALVVDDSATQRTIVKKMLKVQCIESMDASDGLEALKVIEENPDISLVITDFNMPNMNGVEFVQAARHKKSINKLAIIGLSAVGNGSLTAQFLKHGANDFLTKPFDVEEFYWRVNQTLNTQELVNKVKNMKKES